MKEEKKNKKKDVGSDHFEGEFSDILGNFTGAKDWISRLNETERVEMLVDAILEGSVQDETLSELLAWFRSEDNAEAKMAALEKHFLALREKVVPDEKDYEGLKDIKARLGMTKNDGGTGGSSNSMPQDQSIGPASDAKTPESKILGRGKGMTLKSVTDPAPENDGAKSLSPKNYLKYWRYVAVLLPLVVAGTLIALMVGREKQRDTVVAGIDTDIRELLLPDSSCIKVSPNSTVAYNEYGDSLRSVDLTGEAMFKVRKDGKRRFAVHTANMMVSVLGTEFRVTEFPADTYSTVMLFSGAVDVEADDQTTMLSSGQMFTYDFVTHEKTVSTIPPAVMVENGYRPRMIFDDARFSDVLDALAAYYQVKIELGSGVNAETGRVNLNIEDIPLDRALGYLTKMSRKNIGYEISNDTVKIYLKDN